MPSPDQERLEALTESIVQLLRRQDHLEQRLTLLEGKSPPRPAPDTTPGPQSFSPAGPTPLSQATPSPVPQPPKSQSVPSPEPVGLETKVGLTLINRIGVVTLVLGVAFFFKWAVDNNWIGPAGRVMLGILAGMITLWAADVLSRKGQRAFAQGITGTGIAILYLAFYSAFGFYHLIPQALAFVLMCSATGLAFALSLRYDSAAVTALGLFGGYLTPILLSNGRDHSWFLFSYVLLLDAAAMALAKKRNWKLLEIMSVVATTLIYGAWLTNIPRHTDRLPAAVALFAFYALFSQISDPFSFLAIQVLAASAIALIGQGSPVIFYSLALLLAAGGLFYAEQKRLPHMLSASFGSFWLSYLLFRPFGSETPGVLLHFTGVTAGFLLFFLWNVWSLIRAREVPGAQRLSVVALNGIVYYAAAYGLLDSHHHAWLGVLAVGVAGAYLALGVFLYRNVEASAENRPLHLSLGMALAFATLAIPIQFTAFTITIAWSFEAAVLSWIGWRLRDSRVTAAGAFVFVLIAVRLLFLDGWMLPDPRTYLLLWNARLFTFAVASTSLFLAGRWNGYLCRTIALWEYFAGHIALLWGLSLEVTAWAERSMSPLNVLSAETFSLSVLYGLYALILVSAGVATRTAINRVAGLILIGLVIVKLYLFDVWQLQRPYRISAFIALGILLISTSFLYSRFRPLIDSLIRDDKASS